MSIKKLGWMALGFVSLGVAYIGVVLPGIPFSIPAVFAAYCFAKSSDSCLLYTSPSPRDSV